MGRKTKNGHVKLRGLTYSTSKSGKRHYYYRKAGQRKIPLGTGPIDTPEFLERYAEAAKAHPPKIKAKDGTVTAVIDAFMVSTAWAVYSESYKRLLTPHMDAIQMQYGDLPWSSLESRHIRADLTPLVPNAANHRLKAWRNLGRFSFERGWHEANPAETVKGVVVPKTEGHLPWSADQIDAFRERWPIGTARRMCMELLFWTGARCVDAVNLSPSMVKDGVLEFVQQKTKHKAYVPWTCDLPDWALDFERDRQFLFECLRPGVFTFLESSAGRVRQRNGLTTLMIEAAKDAGFQRSAHGLRKSRLTAIAEAGGSAHAIMSWGGHKTLSEAQDYIATADRRRLIMSTPSSKVSTLGK